MQATITKKKKKHSLVTGLTGRNVPSLTETPRQLTEGDLFFLLVAFCVWQKYW